MAVINKIQISGETYDIGGSGGGSSNIVSISQQDYDDLQTKEDDTLYVINDAEEIDLSTKQDKLVSGSNIKTINGESILGGGNIEIKGGGDLPSGNYVSNATNTMVLNNNSEFVNRLDLEVKGFDGSDKDAIQFWFPKINNQPLLNSALFACNNLELATKDELNAKQDKMTNNYLSKVEVGGSSISIETKAFKDESVQKTDTINFKTINGNAIFGMGDIKIEGGGGSLPSGKYLQSLKYSKDGASVGGEWLSVASFQDMYFDGSNGTKNQLLYPKINGQPIIYDNIGNVTVADFKLVEKTDMDGLKLKKLTQSEYDSLSNKDENTLYIING